MAIDGSYDVTIDAMGKQVRGTLTLTTSGNTASGSFSVGDMNVQFNDAKVNGNALTGSAVAPTPMGAMKLKVKATFEGDAISGELNAFLASATFTGTRI